MKRQATILILGLLILASCKTQVPNEVARTMLWNKGLEQWWLVNATAKDQNFQESSFSILFNISAQQNQPHIQLFVSRLDNLEKQATIFRFNGTCKISQKEDNFPLIIESSEGEEHFRLYIGNNHFWLNVDSESKSANFYLKGKLGEISSPFVRHCEAFPSIWSSQYRDISLKQSNFEKSKGQFVMKGFTSAQALVSDYAFTVWIELFDDIEGTNLFLLAQTSHEDNWTIKVLEAYQGNKRHSLSSFEPKLLSEPEKWRSSLSSKSYPLKFELVLEQEIRYEIVPTIENQEIANGKNSFWMGAIHTTAYSSYQYSRGNMLVFSNSKE